MELPVEPSRQLLRASLEWIVTLVQGQEPGSLGLSSVSVLTCVA